MNDDYIRLVIVYIYLYQRTNESSIIKNIPTIQTFTNNLKARIYILQKISPSKIRSRIDYINTPL